MNGSYITQDHLHKDILTNFPNRTSKKIFKGYRQLLDNDNLVFTQKKFDEHGYEYFVKRGDNEVIEKT